VERATKNRVSLWLRSERAFGLESVPWRPQAQLQLAELKSDEQRSAEAGQVVKNLQAAPAARLDGTPCDELKMPVLSAEPFDTPVLSTDDKKRRLSAMDNNEVRGCTRCRLCETRTQTVFGEGDVDAKIFFIGEGPGETEDKTGRPFVGRAGQLLDKMIAGMGLKREQVYIANIVKCRPPGNREPAPDEVATCTPYLQRQLEIVRPRVIVTLGRPSTCHMLQSKTSMGKLRGNWQSWRGIKLMPTWHPAYVLRNPSVEVRGQVWNDLKMVLIELGLPVPVKAQSAQSGSPG
jgi:uracil-DNA glycosylase family 4